MNPSTSVTASIDLQSLSVERLLGEGSQAQVFAVSWYGHPAALKWYRPGWATNHQREMLKSLIEQGPPSNHFLWPWHLVEVPGEATFGYLMPLRDARFQEATELFSGSMQPTFRVLATAGLNLADALLCLHSRGLCYGDISFGNLFLDPNQGDVLICDNDNVAVDGGDNSPIIAGTPRFMAPEIVRREARPSIQTDLYSLSVFLFYVFFVNHPLEGQREVREACMDVAAMLRLYGTNPIFIFDPNNDTNRPVAGIHEVALAHWKIYPRFFCKAFTRAFTDGLNDPLEGRVRESEWRAIMVQFRDSIVPCPACNAENFSRKADRILGLETNLMHCWNCQTDFRHPMWLQIGGDIVVLNRDTELFVHHIDERRRYVFESPVARVVQHPSDRHRLGLRNLGVEPWQVNNASGKSLNVAPGQSVDLVPGNRLNFRSRLADVWGREEPSGTT